MSWLCEEAIFPQKFFFFYSLFRYAKMSLASPGE